MKMIELKPREFHRRIGWALSEARRGVAVVIRAAGKPDVTLSLGRPEPRRKAQGVDWDAHFEWLRKQPEIKVNPVDELRAFDWR